MVVYAVERGEGREVKEAFASDGEPRAADTNEVRKESVWMHVHMLSVSPSRARNLRLAVVTHLHLYI